MSDGVGMCNCPINHTLQIKELRSSGCQGATANIIKHNKLINCCKIFPTLRQAECEVSHTDPLPEAAEPPRGFSFPGCSIPVPAQPRELLQPQSGHVSSGKKPRAPSTLCLQASDCTAFNPFCQPCKIRY